MSVRWRHGERGPGGSGVLLGAAAGRLRPNAFGLEEIQPTPDGVLLDYMNHEGLPVRMVFGFAGNGKILRTHCTPVAHEPDLLPCPQFGRYRRESGRRADGPIWSSLTKPYHGVLEYVSREGRAPSAIK